MGVKETLTDQLKRIVQFLYKQKIDYALAGGLAFSALVEPRATMDIDIEDREMIFDFILAESKFHINAIERAFEIDIFGSKLKVITFEYLILLKTCANRTQDLADLDKIYQTYNKEIDHGYLKICSDKLNISSYNSPGDI